MSELLPEDRIQQKVLITGEPKIDLEHELDCSNEEQVDRDSANRISMKQVNTMINWTAQSGDRKLNAKYPTQYVCCTDQLKLRFSKTEDIVESPEKFPDDHGPSNLIPELMKQKESWRAGWQLDGSHAKPNERLALKGAQDIQFVPNKVMSSSNGANGYNGLIGAKMKNKFYQ